MTSLRTIEGLDLNRIEEAISSRLQAASKKFIEHRLIVEDKNYLKLTQEGKLLADGIAADLFFIEQ